MGYVFVSYSHGDQWYVRRLVEHLQAQGVESWFDHRLVPGDAFGSRIQKAIDDCDAFLVVLTPGAAGSTWVRREIIYADNKRKPVFPLLLSDCHKPIELIALHHEDVRGGQMASNAFVSLIRTLTANPEPADGILLPSNTPRGPRPVEPLVISTEPTTPAASRKAGRVRLALAALVLVTTAAFSTSAESHRTTSTAELEAAGLAAGATTTATPKPASPTETAIPLPPGPDVILTGHFEGASICLRFVVAASVSYYADWVGPGSAPSGTIKVRARQLSPPPTSRQPAARAIMVAAYELTRGMCLKSNPYRELVIYEVIAS